MAEKSIYKIEPLGYDNYSSWAFKMKLLLQKEGVLEVIEKHPPHPITDDWKKKDETAFRIIALAVDRHQEVHVKKVDGSGSKAWKVIREYHQRSSVGARMRLMKKIFTSKLTSDKTMKEYLGTMLEDFDKLNDMGGDLKDEIKVSALMAGLPTEYDGLVTSLETWDDDKLTMAAVKGKLLDEYDKKKEKAGKTDDHEGGKAMKRRDYYGRDYACHSCGELGHFRANCPKKMNYADLREKLNKLESGKVARFRKLYNMNFNSRKKWIIDSGASIHMCAERESFVKFNEHHKEEIVIANGDIVKTFGIGDVIIQVKTSEGPLNITLENVLYLPNADENLLSVKKIMERGFSIEFNKHGCFVTDGVESLKLGRLDGGVWKLNEPERCYAINKSKEKCIHEWHKRLAHRSLNEIRAMEGTDFIIRKCDHSDDCEACIRGKMSRKKFPKKAEPVTEAMDCIVSDVCGPMQIESLGRKRYFVSFIDVFSGYCQLYFIREKSEVPEKVMEFFEYLKTQTGKKVKVLRTDRGTEYLNDRLQNYLKREGIKFECTVGYAPEQNGIAERKNRTLMEATRSMLAESGLGKSLWAEAVDTANFVFNRMIDGKTKTTPYEKLFKRKPKLMEFHEFGADVYSMMPYQRRRKLDDKATKMKFIGYSDTSKGYRLIDRNYRVHISREVKFVDSKEQFKYPRNTEVKCDYYEIYLDEENVNDNQQLVENEEALVVNEEALVENEEELVDNEEELVMDEEGNQGDDDGSIYESMESSEEEAESEPDGIHDVRRSARENIGTMPKRYDDYQMYKVKSDEKFEPRTYNEAINCKESQQWLEAMKKELNAIEENETWIVADLPKGRRAVGSKWVFKIKKDENGKPIYKARLVAQGFTQRIGIDYEEVFAPVTRDTTFRLLLSEAGTKGYSVNQYDIKTAFLNGKLDEEIYLEQPPGFKRGNKVYRLKKCLYGLKQAAHVWNQTLHESLIKNGCVQNETDKCLYRKDESGKICFIIIHVDDMLTATNDKEFSMELMRKIGMDFEIKDLGKVKNYLGIDVEEINGEYFISQKDHIDKIVKEIGLVDGKESKFPLDTGYYKLEGKELSTNEEYRKMIGMLLYLSTKSRPDIAASVAILSQKVSKPRDCDWNEVKRVVRYLKGTSNTKLRLNMKEANNIFEVFSDASWAEDKTDRKSNSGYLCQVNGGTVSWSCKKQSIVTLSSMESEYVALTEACKEVHWLKEVAKGFSINVPDKVVINTDSQSCIEAIRNQKFSFRTKHIDTRHHFIREQVNEGKVELKYKKTEENLADMMTKPLGSTKIKRHREEAGLIDSGGERK